jgi:hypothetical protein
VHVAAEVVQERLGKGWLLAARTAPATG